ncbi:hypothetical protein ABEB36_007921 [Hypothenemus hampei]|uniref:B-block binding subunit of TFIIIC domain-containing protein n=1 Tax=Hypothenemus hampei TaxID=57062 RepID=A0ABD1EW35_HYPHA
MGKFLEPKLSQQISVKPFRKKSVVQLSSTKSGKIGKIIKSQTSSQNPKQSQNSQQELNDFSSEKEDLTVQVVNLTDSPRKYLKLEKFDCDLFADDEQKACFDKYVKTNLIFNIFDEIALEGLDGITLEALWKRLCYSWKFDCLDFNIKNLIFQIVRLSDKITFYKLPEARPNLEIVRNTQEEANVISAIWQNGNEIYKIEMSSKTSGEWGSCSTIDTRINITTELKMGQLKEAEELGNLLVVVAHEKLRKNALFDPLFDPNYELGQIDYCLLEKIGRARDLGEITFGPTALSSGFHIDAKSVYHYCKKLCKENLVARQGCILSSSIETRSGKRINLKRFFSKKKSKHLFMMDTIMNYLKKYPEYTAPYSTVQALFNQNAWSKLLKTSEFTKYLDANIYVPFKDYYVGSTYKEYMVKNLQKERTVQLIRIKDPYVNIRACWNETQHSSDEEDEEEQQTNLITKSRRVFNKDLIRDVYEYILSKGLNGTTSSQLNQDFDADRFTMRLIVKKLIARKLIQTKKYDFGRQTNNQYIAVRSFVEKEQMDKPPKAIPNKPKSALDKLKERQREKANSLDKNRVYGIDQFEADQEHQLLQLDQERFHSITLKIPEVTCQYFAITENHIVALDQETTFNIVNIVLELKPFKIAWKLPKNPKCITLNLDFGLKEDSGFAVHKFSQIQAVLTNDFKVDKFSKALLLRALLDKVNINDPDVLDFLESKKSSKVSQKRPLNETKEVKETKKILGVHMGSNPTVALIEKDDSTGFVVEVHVSKALRGFKTGDITKYHGNASVVTSDRVLTRILFILKKVQQCQIFEDMNKFLKLIYEEELKSGYDKRIDRKSLHRIFKRLTDEGYLKIFNVTLSNENIKKTQTYVCHPEIHIGNDRLQRSLCQFKDETHCYLKKPSVSETKPSEKKVKSTSQRSPFAEADILRSIKEIKDLTSINVALKPNCKAGNHYGRRPKFARLAVLHELLVYLIYEQKKDLKPLPRADVVDLLKKHKIKMSETNLNELPPVYCNEISWKMFIPPMPVHNAWKDGWAFLIDILLRFPLILITRCYFVNFYSKELQDILQHPIKQLYLLKDVSSNIRMSVMYKRKFISEIYNQLVLLTYCGLVQLGPSSFQQKEKSFVYLNRRGCLWDTTSSTPGYLTIENKVYPKLNFYFETTKDVSKYWASMQDICIHTNLTMKSVKEKSKTQVVCDSTVKPSLVNARAFRNQDTVKEFDTGELPGDHKGAGGLDSSLFSHVQRNWLFFAVKNEPSTHLNSSLTPSKIGKVKGEKLPYKNLNATNKYYLAKPHTASDCINRKRKHTKSMKRPIMNKVKPLKRKQKEGPALDATDRATLKKIGVTRYRPSWSQIEDKLLVLLKIASVFVTPGSTSQKISYGVLRDILHIAEPKSRDKTSRNISNRLKILNKVVPLLSNVEALIPNLYKLAPIATYFVPFRRFVLHGEDSKGFSRKFKLSDLELTNAFVFLAYYFIKHAQVETALAGGHTGTDYFNKENRAYFIEKLSPFEEKQKFYLNPQNKDDIYKNTLKSTIHCALSHKSSKPEGSLQTYKIYQQFNEDILKRTLEEMRSQKMIQLKKPLMTFFTPYRLSVYYIFAQSSTFLPQTAEEAHTVFGTLAEGNSNSLNYSYEAMEGKKYGQMFGTNEALSLTFNDAIFNFHIPDHHLILNPNIEDHSEVIDELAKRYYAKLKSEQKPVASKLKIDDEDVEMVELESSDVLPAEAIEPEEIIRLDDDEPLDLSLTNKATIDNLKHWLTDCIDSERVRSPSPEVLNPEIKKELNREPVEEQIQDEIVCSVKENSLLTLEEIKAGMLCSSVDLEKRSVPYISDLTKLLAMNFGDHNESDERAHDLFKKHFVQEYPCLETITLDKTEILKEVLMRKSSNKLLLEKLEREPFVGPATDFSKIESEIVKKTGDSQDSYVAQDILNFIHQKGFQGATSVDLKGHFNDIPFFELIIKILMENGLILRVGVCCLIFVHHEHKDPWLTHTFKLHTKQTHVIPQESSSSNKKFETADIEITKWYQIKAVPWTNIDGTLDRQLLKLWLSQVLSFCIENPKCPLLSVFDKFCYVKPTDVFYLLEILAEIGCVEIHKAPIQIVHLFSEYSVESESVTASFLDPFEEMYIETSNTSFTNLGSFLHYISE